jgi:hypothetical protein
LTRALCAVSVASPLPVLPATAQAAHNPLHLAGQAILVHRYHDPVPGGRSLGELRLVQPVALLSATIAGGHVTLHATANLEGLTVPNGELTTGAWGEGFVDRRHPHTYVHELMIVARGTTGPVTAWLGAGKGFVPFGTDDPLSRPPLSYPVNHHLSQILERAQIVAAIGVPPLPKSPVLLEASAFNGDEPTTPGAWPSLDRLGDSWAVRLTARPAATLEAQVSHAAVRSPEHPGGAGLDHAKWSAALRWADRRRYALAEWARTSEGGGAFVFHSTLFEVARSSGRHRPYARFERTERPEEERTGVFRSRRPLRDNGILGITRWTLWTAGYRHHIRTSQRAVFEPFSELTLGSVAMVGGGVFDAEGYYGGRSFAAAAIGMRLSRGLDDHRMGRYTH